MTSLPVPTNGYADDTADFVTAEPDVKAPLGLARTFYGEYEDVDPDDYFRGPDFDTRAEQRGER